MRTNKPAIKWSFTLSVIALAVSILTQYVNYIKCAYISNLFSGIFASGVLALAIAIINYCAERKKTLEKFCSYMQKAISNYNKYENNGDLEKTINIVLDMNQFDYLELDTAFGGIDFLFKDQESAKIYL